LIVKLTIQASGDVADVWSRIYCYDACTYARAMGWTLDGCNRVQIIEKLIEVLLVVKGYNVLRAVGIL
jgi:hypothetical protein